MGNIPEFRSSFISTLALSRNRGDELARSVGRLTDQTSNIALNEALEKKATRDVNAVNESVIGFEREAMDLSDTFKKDNQSEPQGKSKEFDDFLKLRLDEVGKTMPSPDAQVAFGRESLRIRSKYGQQMTAWENNQEVENWKSKSARVTDDLNTMAYRQADLSAIPDLLKQADATKVSDSLLVGTEDAEGVRQARRKSITQNTFLGLVDSDLQTAKTELASGDYDKELGTDGIKQMQRAIDQKERQAAALAKKLEGLKKKDPYMYLEAVGDTAGLYPISVGSDDAAQSFLDRSRFIERVQQEHGIKVPPLMPEEQEMVTKMIEGGNETAATVMVSSIERAVTDDQYIPITQQLFEKQPAIGIGFAIVSEDPDATKQIFKGHRLIKNKAITMPRPTDFSTDYFAHIGNAITVPEFRHQTLEAVKAHYAATVQEQGEASDTLDSDILENSVKAVIGDVFSFNGEKTLSFRAPVGEAQQLRFLDEDEFEDFVDDLTEDNFKGNMPMTLEGDSMDIEELQNDAVLVPVSDGAYYVRLFDEYAVDKKGNPYILNLKKMYPGSK